MSTRLIGSVTWILPPASGRQICKPLTVQMFRSVDIGSSYHDTRVGGVILVHNSNMALTPPTK